MGKLINGDEACVMLQMSRKTLLKREIEFFTTILVGKKKMFDITEILDYQETGTTEKSRNPKDITEMVDDVDSVKQDITEIADDVHRTERQVLFDVITDAFTDNFYDFMGSDESLHGGGFTKLLAVFTKAFDVSVTDLRVAYKEHLRGNNSGFPADYKTIFDILEKREFEDRITPLGIWL